MKQILRRQFLVDSVLKSTVFAGGLVGIGAVFKAQNQDWIDQLSEQAMESDFWYVAGHTTHFPKNYGPRKLTDFAETSIKGFSLNGDSFAIPSPVFCHSIFSFPTNRDQVLGIPKWDNKIAVFNLRQKKMERVIQAPIDCRYFGHGCINSTGDRLYLSMMNDRTNEGQLAIYDIANDLSFVESLPSFGIDPHEILHDTTSNQLIIAHAGADATLAALDLATKNLKSGIARIDISTGKLANYLEIPQAEGHPVSHLIPIGESKYFFGTSHRDLAHPMAGILENSVFKELEWPNEFDEKFEEVTSLVHSSLHGRLAAAIRIKAETHVLAIWDEHTHKLLKRIPFFTNLPISLSPDLNHILASDSKMNVFKIDIRNFSFSEVPQLRGLGQIGVHLAKIKRT